MDVSFLLKGLLIGVSIAAPVGPIGVLCIRRTLTDGRLSGFISGLGAATADAVYGGIAGFGLTLVSDFLINQQLLLRWVGGLFLCYLGIKTLLAAPAERAAGIQGGSLAKDYLSTLFLTLTNPMTILSFAAIFAGLGIASEGKHYAGAGLLVLGVFLGSACWWLLLSGLAGAFREKLSHQGLRWVNRISGMIILAFGMIVLWGAIR
jgi:threonine/homoserine/homoserine lactone efflux protein